MTRKNDAFNIDEDLSDLFSESMPSTSSPISSDGEIRLSIEKALNIVIEQMRQQGLRTRTMIDYERYVTQYANVAEIADISEITADSVYLWLSSMQVANSTKLIRLKCLRAFFERCHTNGWLTNPFWRNINIKVSTPIKRGASEKDIMFVLSLLDLSDFVHLRDATAILTLYQTGIRVETAALLREAHIDLKSKCLRLSGDIMKNHDMLILPFDDRLARLFNVLIEQNAKIRKDKRTNNDYVFITQRGDSCLRSPTNNNIAKRINKYRKEFGIKNFSAHSIRRAFAKNLYRKSNRDLALVSKALGHSDFAVTTRYLHLSAEEVAEDIRKYL